MSRRVHSPLAAVAALALSACTTLAPVHERPVAPVPTAFPGGAASGTPAAPLPDWRTYFREPALQALVEASLSGNRELRSATLAIERARALYDIRDAERLPSAGVGASVNRARGPTGAVGTSYTVGLLASAWEIDFFGRLASLAESARAQFLATTEAQRATQVSLVASVASTWLSLAHAEALIELSEGTLAAREDSLRLVRLRFEHGASSELDLRQAQSLAETARATLAQQKRLRALDLHALGLLTGQVLPADYRTGVPAGGLRLPPLPAGLPSEILTRRPDVMLAEQQLRAANADIGAARAAFFPRITLTAGLGSASAQLGSLFTGGTWAFTAAPQLLQPIFDAGRNRASLAAAEAARDVAIAQYERVVQVAFREVADALASQATLAEQLQAQQRVAEAETGRLQLSKMRFDAGVASQLELLDAQRAGFAAQQAEIQLRLLALQNQVALYRALGGGWADTEAAVRP